MITVWNKEDGTVCCIDEVVLNWDEHVRHLYYDPDTDTDTDMVAFRLIDSINNSTGSQWGIEHIKL